LVFFIFKLNLGCIGAGYVGGITMSIISKYNEETNVFVYDSNKERIKEWNSDQLPFYEVGLGIFIYIKCRRNSIRTKKKKLNFYK
jgi:UDP-glucose 6-dehydrogenase